MKFKRITEKSSDELSSWYPKQVGRVVDDLSLMTNRQFDEMFRRVSHKPRRVDTKLNAMLSIIRQQQERTSTK